MSLAFPTRGGWLTILNCVLWAVLAVGGSRGDRSVPDQVVVPLVLCISLPAALPCLMPGFGHWSAAWQVVQCVLIGVNSVVWGYGLSWIWTVTMARPRERDRVRRGLCPACGYDLRATPGRCPECGKEAGA